MKSLENQIRNLMIAMAMEQDRIYIAMTEASGDVKQLHKLADRRARLEQLAHRCISNIDKEIEFFQK